MEIGGHSLFARSGKVKARLGYKTEETAERRSPFCAASTILRGSPFRSTRRSIRDVATGSMSGATCEGFWIELAICRVSLRLQIHSRYEGKCRGYSASKSRSTSVIRSSNVGLEYEGRNLAALKGGSNNVLQKIFSFV
jgi:hypothetical protein